MKRCLLLAALICGGQNVQAQKLSEEETRDGFISLFNGSDFSGWRFGATSALAKLPANWKVEDGVIKVTGTGGPNLASQRDYEDFDLRLQWRAMRDKYNSGLYIRSGRQVGANQINLAKGGEGAFLGNTLKGAKAVPKLQKEPMEWNEWRVLAVGDKVTFWCNGQMAWEGTEFKTPRGYLGLQDEGAPLEFRNIRIKEIGFEPLNDLKQWTGADGKWKQEGDILTSSDSDKPLTTARKDFKDYVLRLEWRENGEEATGAFLLRGDGNAGQVPLGAMTSKVNNPLGQWNYLELRVADNKATLWLNGTETAPALDAAKLPAAGPIALVAKSPKMEYRNVRIKEIKN